MGGRAAGIVADRQRQSMLGVIFERVDRIEPASRGCGVGKGGGEESDGVKWTGSEVEAFGRTKRGSGLVDGVWHLTPLMGVE